ncbi:GT4 family glycosyltransferase PelF [Tenacibaculum maritimum]|nr:GT4 family glycosyltransferase PelF [Tenacibaculum maritimum]MCD9563671.1 GT4 family glycosyltransferase PelF [Tenacibaculum maritimum]MCD9566318.1 GT4 family glycosyltransferase PelF [Tenacibaculum maritimum]MCD9579679.1 GT4 family glycosyltransferase PelF [Tenacibaculum maritimum]MCD9596901.1 GT4 family glycosyltransferase PelF [Tenacibaculum maritimum]MCD9614061.1 GT4 family glycosyltransferase PelF [Tenacibaculum maritimum]
MNKRVLLITEGTYPYNYGGVSSWSHTLCNLTRGIDFHLYSLNSEFERQPRYLLGKNIKSVTQLPLWAYDHPFDLIDYNISYKEVIEKKLNTTDFVINQQFIPLFRILIKNLIADHPNLDHLEQTVYNLYDYFKKHDYDKTLKSLPVWKEFKTILIDASLEEIEKITLEDISFSLRWLSKMLMTLSIPVPEVDIAHITLTGFPVIPALIAKKEHGSLVLGTEHGIFIREHMIYANSAPFSFFIKNLMIRCSTTITKLAFTKSDKVTSVNIFNTTWEFKFGLSEDRSEIIYNGVDEHKFSCGKKPEHLKDTPTVVAIARIFALKDILTMIRTCGHVKKTIPDIRFLVYGDKNAVPEYTLECNKLIKELELTDNFILAGHHSAPNKAFLEGDISILTSISEGFPYTVIESMSCGVPVVATDVGGVSEAITDTTGFICQPKKFEDLGNKVIYLLQNKEIRLQMGQNARKRVLEHFTIDKIMRTYEDLYLNLQSASMVVKKVESYAE